MKTVPLNDSFKSVILSEPDDDTIMMEEELGAVGGVKPTGKAPLPPVLTTKLTAEVKTEDTGEAREEVSS